MIHEVVAALIVQAGRILLGQRSPTRVFYPGVWDMFGGHVEPGEDPSRTLVRELEEELGITPVEWSFLETLRVPVPDQRDEEPDEMIAHLCRVTAWSGTPANRQPEEHDIIGWFSLEEALQLDLSDPLYRKIFVQYLGDHG